VVVLATLVIQEIQDRLLAAAVQVGMAALRLFNGGPVLALAVQAVHITFLLLQVAGSEGFVTSNPVVARRGVTLVRRVMPGVQPLYLGITTPGAMAVMGALAVMRVALPLETLVTGVTVTNI